jgi:hypothetical protein
MEVPVKYANLSDLSPEILEAIQQDERDAESLGQHVLSLASPWDRVSALALVDVYLHSLDGLRTACSEREQDQTVQLSQRIYDAVRPILINDDLVSLGVLVALGFALTELVTQVQEATVQHVEQHAPVTPVMQRMLQAHRRMVTYLKCSNDRQKQIVAFLESDLSPDQQQRVQDLLRQWSSPEEQTHETQPGGD